MSSIEYVCIKLFYVQAFNTFEESGKRDRRCDYIKS